jgi:DsbE subfamily thiol:disulfide oxidoreductase
MARRVCALLSVGAVVLVTATACTKVQADPSTAILVRDDPMPVIAGDSLEGRPISSQDLAGKVLVVNAWATWCGPCEQEQPALVKVAQHYRDHGVRFLGILQTDDPAAGLEWVRSHGVPYASVDDQAGEFAGDLGYIGLPNTFVVDAAGVIRFQLAGATDVEQLSGLLDRVLAGSEDGPSPG